MLYVYILRSKKDNKLCIGKTKNLKKRFEAHNKGRVQITKGRQPFELIYYEAFNNATDWSKEELFLKPGIGKESLKHRLQRTLL
jgi:predicted GIY-YIG superfamily endonuclease